MGEMTTLELVQAITATNSAETAVLRSAINEVRSLVMSTDGEFLDGSDFDGLVGEIQRVLHEHDLLDPNHI